MDTRICGATAYRYWRIPPIVQLLAVGPEDDEDLQKLASPEELLELRGKLASMLPLSRFCTTPGPNWRRSGADAGRIRDAHALLALCSELPVEILVTNTRQYHRSELIKPRVWRAELTPGSCARITDELYATTPEFTMLQLCAHASLAQTVLLASELCGSFATFACPAPIKAHLEMLHRTNRLFDYGGWKPSFVDGKLTDLWSRDPLTHPAELKMTAQASPVRIGKTKLLMASQLTVPNAASPFEVQAGMLLGFPRRLGGEGHSGFTYNAKVQLSNDARLLAQRDTCYCDLLWDERLDLECQSVQYHDNEDSYLSDSDRTAALKLMGIDVLPVTYKQLSSRNRFDALSRTVSTLRGIPFKPATQRERALSDQLRAEVLVNWDSLLDF